MEPNLGVCWLCITHLVRLIPELKHAHYEGDARGVMRTRRAIARVLRRYEREVDRLNLEWDEPQGRKAA